MYFKWHLYYSRVPQETCFSQTGDGGGWQLGNWVGTVHANQQEKVQHPRARNSKGQLTPRNLKAQGKEPARLSTQGCLCGEAA